MANRLVLNRWIEVTTALALMVAVITSPIRPSRSANYPSDHACLRRNFSLPPARSTPQSVTPGISGYASRVKALPSEDREEEELTWTTRPACYLFIFQPSSPPKPARDSASGGPIRAIRPLRC